MQQAKSAPRKVLFIGNSATYVNDIPGTLKELAEKAGYPIECERIVKGGAKLSFHADTSTIHGQTVLETIQKGFDIVFIQDNANCISSDQLKLESKNASLALGSAIRASGAEVGIYFRPPYGYKEFGLDPLLQCEAIDLHFCEIASALGAISVYVNRAFAEAIRHTDFDLWGPDHAHTSAHGAYLAVCVFFSTIFQVSSAVLDTNGLPKEDAAALQAIADKLASRSFI